MGCHSAKANPQIFSPEDGEDDETPLEKSSALAKPHKIWALVCCEVFSVFLYGTVQTKAFEAYI
jgi:hypothetical protein